METHQLWFSCTLGWHILSCPFGWAFTSVMSSGKTHSWCESPFVSGWRALWGHSIWVHLSPFTHLALLPLQVFVFTEQLMGSIKLPPAQACLIWGEFWAVWHSPPPADTWATQLGSVGQDLWGLTHRAVSGVSGGAWKVTPALFRHPMQRPWWRCRAHS